MWTVRVIKPLIYALGGMCAISSGISLVSPNSVLYYHYICCQLKTKTIKQLGTEDMGIPFKGYNHGSELPRRRIRTQ